MMIEDTKNEHGDLKSNESNLYQKTYNLKNQCELS